MQNLRTLKSIRSLVVCLFILSVAVPSWSDTLVLKNGASISGTLTGANVNTLTFTDRRGTPRRYSVAEVDYIQFGDAPNTSQGGPAGFPPPPPDRRDDRNNGNDPSNAATQDDHDYDQARMERVVLPAGTEVAVLTNERVDSKDVVQGQTFSAQISEDIRGNDGFIAIPRGSDVRLVTRRIEGNGDLTLDVESIVVGGRRYRVSTEDQEFENRKEGVGGNKRTGQYVGGGAIFGAIIGAIAGGGKGAAIGAVAGAGAGAGVQTITRGKEVHVPAETVVRFRLDRPLHLHLWA